MSTFRVFLRLAQLPVALPRGQQPEDGGFHLLGIGAAREVRCDAVHLECDLLFEYRFGEQYGFDGGFVELVQRGQLVQVLRLRKGRRDLVPLQYGEQAGLVLRDR